MIKNSTAHSYLAVARGKPVDLLICSLKKQYREICDIREASEGIISSLNCTSIFYSRCMCVLNRCFYQPAVIDLKREVTFCLI